MKLIECPRDAMQGIANFIPTDLKADYINTLLQVGFDTIDFGSFVSLKAIPQMRDTAEVLSKLHLNESSSKLLAIVANERGAQDAIQFDEITYLGFPFSVSETFQQRNANSSIEESLHRVDAIKKLCDSRNKKLVVYLSMAFGNPYGDVWNSEIVTIWGKRLVNDFGIEILAPSDTVGSSTPESILDVFTKLIPEVPAAEVGAHLHTTPYSWKEKVEAVVASGCKRMDGALKGFGGCPMATEELTGNMPTELAIGYLEEKKLIDGINHNALQEALKKAASILS
jgi:hydroxymethylglutaryl-CoA lyase